MATSDSDAQSPQAPPAPNRRNDRLRAAASACWVTSPRRTPRQISRRAAKDLSDNHRSERKPCLSWTCRLVRGRIAVVLHAGASRRRIARTLNAAYAGGLLRDETFAGRLDQLLKSRLVDPLTLIGDLNLRRAGRPVALTSSR